MTFAELKLMPALLKALGEANYTTPTPIQQKAIPPSLEGRDVLGLAQTGTGKTAAFSLPILQRLATSRPQPNAPRRIRALIVTPTRELAIQIQENLDMYSRHLRMRTVVVVGGVSQRPQEVALGRGCDILVATPGRLLDLVQQKHADLKHVEVLVLDEADRMLDMGFIHDVKRILKEVTNRKQTLFFSATMPPEVTKLVQSILVDPVRVEITPVSSTAERIDQSVYLVDKENKLNLLLHLLKDRSIVSALVFTRTKHGADRVVRGLKKENVAAAAIHGDKSQNARQAALNGFKNGTTRVLVATDIAARGIDIDELSHVINYNLPNIPETYVHRIGRTGRAGLSGTAISFCEDEELPYLKDIEKLTRKKIPVVADHPYPMTQRGQAHAPSPSQSQRPQQASQGQPRQGQRPQQASQGQPRQGQRPQQASQGQPRQGQRPQQASQGQPRQGQSQGQRGQTYSRNSK